MSLARARQLRDELTAAGVRAVTSARSVVAPCVLIAPPARAYDVSCGYSATWQLWVIGTGGGDEGSWQQLDELTDQLAELVDIETATPSAWRSSSDAAEAAPAYLCTFTEAVDSTA